MRAAILIGHFGAGFEVGNLDEDAEYAFVRRRRRGGIVYVVGTDIRVTRPTGARSPEADLAVLRMMLAWATRTRTEHGSRLLAQNPLAGARRPQTRRPKRRPVATYDRYLRTDDAMARLEKAADDDETVLRWARMRVALFLAESTGRRLGAIRQLRWEDFDWNEGTVTWRADADKCGEQWVIPMSRDFFARLATLDAPLVCGECSLPAARGWVFACVRKSGGIMDRHLFDHWLRVAEEAAQLPKLRGGLWHPYRRKWSIERKHHPLVDVAAAGGWRDTATLIECYSQADPETLLSVTSEPRKFGGNGFTSEPMSNVTNRLEPDQTTRAPTEGPRA